MSPIEKAAVVMGSQKKLAEAIGVTPGRVWQWIHQPELSRNRIAPDKCNLIEKATNGQVRREQLRPDIFAPVSYGETISEGVA